MTNMQIDKLAQSVSNNPSNATIVPGGNSEHWETIANVKVTIFNTGLVSGAAVTQSIGRQSPT